MMRIFNINLTVLLIFISQSCLSMDSLVFNKKSALFRVTDKTIPIVTATHISWEKDWSWAGARLNPEQTDAKDKTLMGSYTGKIPRLDVDFKLSTKQLKQRLEWSYDLQKKLSHPNAIGFGIQFKLKLDSPSFETKPNNPELLPDNRGWRWLLANGEGIEVTFSPGVAKVFFERNQKNTIRAMFFNAVEPGTQKVVMSVNLLGDKHKTAKQVTTVGDTPDIKSWDKAILSNLASPIDLSFLNADHIPAGKHGFVKAAGDKLVFADGTPAKFWGANVQALALFRTSEMDIKAHAKRIAQLGFNLIRITHHDSKWVRPNVFETPSDNTLHLSDKSLKKLDWWIKCLKDEGVYIWLDLHVGRTFTKNDGIEYFSDIAKRNDKAGVVGFNYVNDSIQKRMQSYNEDYLNHINTFTHLAYKDDPAVIALLITNENDLTHHYAFLFLPANGFKTHSDLFKAEIKNFAASTGLSEAKSAIFWQMGESKIFLANMEHRFNLKMLSHLKSIGAKSMLVTTSNWGNMGLISLPSLTDSDLIDTHSYAKENELEFNPRFNPGYLSWIGGSQVTGKPLSVSEWNMDGYPILDRHTLPLFTASIASLQGWDALMLYGYSQDPMGQSGRGSNWTGFSDPAMMGLMPAAALLYRQGHVLPSIKNYDLKLSDQDFYYKKQDPVKSKTIRTLLETSRFSVSIPKTKGLTWINDNPGNAKATVITDADKDYIPAGQNFVQSDTGELKRDWGKGIHTVNTPKSQIASGKIGGENIQLGDTGIKIATQQAVVAVQSLDKNRIKNSKAIFISLMARALTGAENKLPFSAEQITGDITINAPRGLRLFPINDRGEKQPPVKTSYNKGRYHIQLESNNKYHWFMLTGG